MLHLSNYILLDLCVKILSVIIEGEQKVSQLLLVLCHAFLQCSMTELQGSKSLSNQSFYAFFCMDIYQERFHVDNTFSKVSSSDTV